MTWTQPIDWVFRQVMSASLLNQQWRDNLLYLKTRPYDIAELGTTNQTGITTAWVKVTNSDLQVTLPVNGVLEFGWRMVFSHSVANNHLSVDIFDVDNNVYLSSGTGTPITGGLMRNASPASIAAICSGSFIHVAVPSGTHNYEFRVLAQAASATIHNNISRNAVWVKEIG